MGSAAGTALPVIAVLLSNIQLASPLQTALKCRRENDLGPLNPVPWAVSFINCAGYMIYGSVIGNAYLMCSVTLGLVMNFFAMTTALRILGTKAPVPIVRTDSDSNKPSIQPIDFAWQIEAIALGGISLWILVAFIAGSVLPAALGDNANKVAINLVGNVCCTTSLLYYFSPLSVLVDIVKRGDAAGLHAPLITLNLVATTMWSAYGLFYMNDVNVYAPNISAMALSIAQLSIKAYYPSSDGKKSDDFMRLTGDGDGAPHGVEMVGSAGSGAGAVGGASTHSDHNPLHRSRRSGSSSSLSGQDMDSTVRSRRRTLSEVLPVIHEVHEVVPLTVAPADDPFLREGENAGVGESPPLYEGAGGYFGAYMGNSTVHSSSAAMGVGGGGVSSVSAMEGGALQGQLAGREGPVMMVGAGLGGLQDGSGGGSGGGGGGVGGAGYSRGDAYSAVSDMDYP